MFRYFKLNLQTLVACIGRMWKTPLATLFTIVCVGIILSLPSGLYMLHVNLSSVAALVNSTPEITVFVAQEATEDSIDQLSGQIRNLPQVRQADVITADEALEEFKQTTGLESIVEYVQDNPLPSILVVQPAESHYEPVQLQQLVDDIRAYEIVDAVEVDLEWVRRLHSILGLVQTLSVVVSALLLMTAILVVCNTTRLSISSRLDEIMVIEQIGATRAFIRRPFVYTAVLHSLMSVAFAAAIMEGCRAIFADQIRDLASLYSSGFQLIGISWQAWLIIAVLVSLVSWIAARITIRICLRSLAASRN